MLRIMVINGPNLNLLGRREPEIYGRASYADLVKLIYKHCEEMQVQCKIMQSNHEGALVDAIQQAADFCDCRQPCHKGLTLRQHTKPAAE